MGVLLIFITDMPYLIYIWIKNYIDMTIIFFDWRKKVGKVGKKSDFPYFVIFCCVNFLSQCMAVQLLMVCNTGLLNEHFYSWSSCSTERRTELVCPESGAQEDVSRYINDAVLFDSLYECLYGVAISWLNYKPRNILDFLMRVYFRYTTVLPG